MRELSLFTGAGGGLLGTMLLGWTPIGAVEWDDYCCRVLEQRQRDGLLPAFPIYQMDIREFNRRVAPLYAGLADVVTAGFNCQPWSPAGKGLGADDPRNTWPATIECIRIVRPRYALLENVPRLVTSGYFGAILQDLAESGYDARWDVLSAAPFVDQRDGARLWILVQARSERLEGVHQKSRGKPVQSIEEIVPRHKRKADAGVYRAGNGVAHRVERTRAIGNGQVPAMVRAAWNLLSGGE
jgi:DNA (cytosine-5)-methyltransferase 1